MAAGGRPCPPRAVGEGAALTRELSGTETSLTGNAWLRAGSSAPDSPVSPQSRQPQRRASQLPRGAGAARAAGLGGRRGPGPGLRFPVDATSPSPPSGARWSVTGGRSLEKVTRPGSLFHLRARERL